MAQHTAVEWLVEQIKSDQNQKALSANEWLQVIEQAKQMEKEQIKEGYIMSLLDSDNKIRRDAEDYYNETYGKE